MIEEPGVLIDEVAIICPIITAQDFVTKTRGLAKMHLKGADYFSGLQPEQVPGQILILPTTITCQPPR